MKGRASSGILLIQVFPCFQTVKVPNGNIADLRQWRHSTVYRDKLTAIFFSCRIVSRTPTFITSVVSYRFFAPGIRFFRFFACDYLYFLRVVICPQGAYAITNGTVTSCHRSGFFRCNQFQVSTMAFGSKHFYNFYDT